LRIAGFFYLDSRHRAQIAEIQSRDAKTEAELAQRQADIAREERTVLLNELTDITQKISTQLRFTPGTSATISQMLIQVQDFSNRFHVLLKAHSTGELSDQDQRVAARLDFTARILQADFDINFGKVGEAITILKNAEADLAKVPAVDGQPARSVQLLLADLLKHRADGETLYAATDDARRDYAAAAQGYTTLAQSPPPSAGEELQSGTDYPQTAKQRLAELYQGRIFLELQFIDDGHAAAEDFARYKELVVEQSAAHPPGAHDQVSDYWAQQQSRLDRLQADVWVAQGRLDEAIQIYNRLIERGSVVTTVMAEVGDAFLKYKTALALTKRAQGSDLADAVGHLKHADHVFARLAANDPKNSWWPLVCGWIERTLGDAYMQQHDAGNAAAAYQEAIDRDLALHKFDEQNPRVEKDLRQDTAALAAAKNG
jgi:tetratricopeptide (TPR) repeat protein